MLLFVQTKWEDFDPCAEPVAPLIKDFDPNGVILRRFLLL